VLDSGATNLMATGDKGCTIRRAGSGAEVTLANGDKVPIKGHGHVFMCDGPSHGPHTRGTRFPGKMPNYPRFQYFPLATHL